jgi:hypothetical protein
MVHDNLVDMEQLSSSRVVKRVCNPKVADWLTSPEAPHLLRPFLGRSASVSEAAGMLRLSVKDMHYRTRRMVSLGILEVVEEVARAGRPVKRYATNCDEFFVPFALTQATTVAERLLHHLQPSLGSIASSIALHMGDDHERSGLGFSVRADSGKVTLHLSPDGAPAEWSLCEYWLDRGTAAMYAFAGRYHLERNRAKEVQRRIDELLADVARYQQEAEHSSTAQSYHLLLTLAPDLETL